MHRDVLKTCIHIDIARICKIMERLYEWLYVEFFSFLFLRIFATVMKENILRRC